MTWLLLVTWIVPGQPPSSYTATYNSEAACIRARAEIEVSATTPATDVPRGWAKQSSADVCCSEVPARFHRLHGAVICSDRGPAQCSAHASISCRQLISPHRLAARVELDLATIVAPSMAGSMATPPARRRDRACRYRRRNTRGPHPRSVAPPRAAHRHPLACLAPSRPLPILGVWNQNSEETCRSAGPRAKPGPLSTASGSGCTLRTSAITAPNSMKSRSSTSSAG